MSYTPASTTALMGSGTVTLNCVKTGTNQDTRFIELGAGSGLNPLGGQNRAMDGAEPLAYALTRTPAGTLAWSDAQGNRLATSVTSTTSTTVSLNWWIVVPAAQLVSSGTYQDTVQIRLYQGTSANPALSDPSPLVATLPISLSVSSLCTISSPPANLLFSYTSFQASPAVASSSFAVTCTRGAPFTVALDSPSGVLLGLAYQLALSATGTLLGTGVPQPLSISGTMAAGQSGTCAQDVCNASRQHTITITY